MKKYLKHLLCLGLLGLSGSVYAEGGCPEGQFPQQYGTTMGCTTMNAGGNQPVAPVWADRWGAIASDGNGTYGIVTDKASRRKAQKTAIEECKKRGGGSCAVRRDFYNQCAAVTSGTITAATANAPTEDEAVKIGKEICRTNGDNNCQVYWSGCSMPVRVN